MSNYTDSNSRNAETVKSTSAVGGTRGLNKSLLNSIPSVNDKRFLYITAVRLRNDTVRLKCSLDTNQVAGYDWVADFRDVTGHTNPGGYGQQVTYAGMNGPFYHSVGAQHHVVGESIELFYGSNPMSATITGGAIAGTESGIPDFAHYRPMLVNFQSGYQRIFQVFVPGINQKVEGNVINGSCTDFTCYKERGRVDDCWQGDTLDGPYEWKSEHAFESTGNPDINNQFIAFTGTNYDPGGVFGDDAAATFNLSDVTNNPSSNKHDTIYGARKVLANAVNFGTSGNNTPTSLIPYPDQNQGGPQEFKVIIEDREEDSDPTFTNNINTLIAGGSYNRTFDQEVTRLSQTSGDNPPSPHGDGSGLPTQYPFTFALIYADNLVDCGVSPITYDVCDDPQSSNHYLTSGLDCNLNAIPADALSGITYAIFDSASACCPFDPCSIEAISYTTCASFNGSDGEILVDFSVSGQPGTFSGFPFLTGNPYTVTLTNNFGATVLQTDPPVGGSVYSGISGASNWNTNTNPWTPDSRISIPGGDNTIATGMRVYQTVGTSMPTNIDCYVGDILESSLTHRVTKFRLVDINGAHVDLLSVGTFQLEFVVGHTHTFSHLPATTGGGDTYTITVEDGNSSQTCRATVTTTLCENAPIDGCIDPTAVNYDPNANQACGAVSINPDCCLTCNASTGELEDLLGVVQGNLFALSTFTGTPTTDETATDGEIFVQATVLASVIPFLQNSTQSYTLTLYELAVANDFATAGSALQTTTGLSISNYSTSPYDTFTGLGYGHYAVKIQLVDSNQVLNIEDCFDIFFGDVKAFVCTNPSALNVNVTVPVILQETDNGQCLYPINCCVIHNPLIISVSNCSDSLQVSILCDPVAVTIDTYWCYGNLSTVIPNSAGTQMTNVGTSAQTISLSETITAVYGAGSYIVVTNAVYGTGQTCQVTETINYTPDVCGCTDPTAMNYNPLATIDDGSCIPFSWNCISPGYCANPGDGLGQYATQSLCLIGCPIPPVSGCTDPCAANYDPAAVIDDGSCAFKICSDPTAYNYQYSCDCSAQKPSGTISDPSCCFYPCANAAYLSTAVVDTTGSCTTQNTDGTVVVFVILNNGATTWDIYYENNAGTVIFIDVNGGNGSGVYSGNTNAQPYLGLASGTYSAYVTDNYGCVQQIIFSIGNTTLLSGCTDPAATNYNPSATCDDGSCVCCGCTDPLALNYNPNAICNNSANACCECIYNIVETPCVPANIDTTIALVDSCLSNNGSSYVSKLLIGKSDECSIMNNWKLIFIKYLLDRKGLYCLYNCADGKTPSLSATSAGIDCEASWITGGPVTGSSDQGFAGSSIISGEGTTVTDASLFFVAGNILYPGDVIKFSGSIWSVVSQTNYNPATCLGAQSNNWHHCNDVMGTISITDTTNYLDNFTNFVNNFCKDCVPQAYEGYKQYYNSTYGKRQISQNKKIGGQSNITQGGINFNI